MRAYQADGSLYVCPACHRVARWRRFDVGAVVVLCACGTPAPRAVAVATECVRLARLTPAVDPDAGPTEYPSLPDGCC